MVFTADGMALWDGGTTPTFDSFSLKARFGSAPPSVALQTVALSVSAAPLQMAATPKLATSDFTAALGPASTLSLRDEQMAFAQIRNKTSSQSWRFAIGVLWENTGVGGAVEGIKTFVSTPNAGNGAMILAGIIPGGRMAGRVIPKAGMGGRFGSFKGVKGDDLTPHHIPQAAAGFTTNKDGGAIVMTTAEHARTRTFGALRIATKKADASLSFRQVLEADIRDVRSIVGSKYNKGLLDVIKYYKKNCPE
jgi:hypothetical protein